MEYIPCSKRRFPFRIELFTFYALYFRWLKHLDERLGYQNILPIWKETCSDYDDHLLIRILASGWYEVETSETIQPNARVDELFAEFFASSDSELSMDEAKNIIEETPPIRQTRKLFPDQFSIEKECTAYDALHIRFDGLACLAEAIIGKYGKQGELIIYDLMAESRLASSQGKMGSVAEFIESFTSVSDASNLFTAGLEMEVISKSAREAAVHIKECEWARYFQENHPKVGYLMACSTDEFAYKAFNPDLRLQRTGTIMEGSRLCDFRIYAIDESQDHQD